MFAASDSTNVAKSRDSWPVPFRCIETNGSDKKAHQGVFIVQGTNLRVSNISLSIDRTTGEVTAAPIQLETSIDVSPEWLKVAIDHAVTAAEIEDEAEVAHHAGDDTALGTQLRQVMREGMQAIAAAAFAIAPGFAVALAPAAGNPAPETSNPDADTLTRLLGTGEGRITITACREGQLSYVGRGTLTIFTQALIDALRGMNISVTTTAKTDEEARALLGAFKFPFRN